MLLEINEVMIMKLLLMILISGFMFQMQAFGAGPFPGKKHHYICAYTYAAGINRCYKESTACRRYFNVLRVARCYNEQDCQIKWKQCVKDYRALKLPPVYGRYQHSYD